VKGAYLEPASVAYPKKMDVDANYVALASRLLLDDNTEARRAVAHCHA
jgi:proline dehydrogenase